MMKAAFTGNFEEGHTRSMTLEDVEDATFESFVTWVYTQAIPFVTGIDGITDYESDNINLIRLWILADRLLIPQLQNSAIFRLEESRRRYKHKLLFPLEIAKEVYEQTETTSPLRRYLVDLCAAKFNHKVYANVNNRKLFPQEMLLDLLETCSKIDQGDIRKLGNFLFIDIAETSKRYYVAERVEKKLHLPPVASLGREKKTESSRSKQQRGQAGDQIRLV